MTKREFQISINLLTQMRRDREITTEQHDQALANLKNKREETIREETRAKVREKWMDELHEGLHKVNAHGTGIDELDEEIKEAAGDWAWNITPNERNS